MLKILGISASKLQGISRTPSISLGEELRQKALEADLWAGKGRKPTPSCDVHHAWSLGLNKVFTREVEKASTKNLVKEKLR